MYIWINKMYIILCMSKVKIEVYVEQKQSIYHIVHRRIKLYNQNVII